MNPTKDRYRIEDFHIIDAEGNPTKEIYIREVLDSLCAEFQLSKLGARQKLEIIATLGLDSLTKVLDDCYRSNGKPLREYNAAHEAESALLTLRKKPGGNALADPRIP